MLNIETLPLGENQTNCYLVWEENSDTSVVIDPGYAPDIILNKVAALGKTVEAVCLTHAHFDHVGGVRKIVETTDCPLYVSQKEWAMPSSWLFPLNGTAFENITYYKEGDKLSLADAEFLVLETPGHTPGCVCLQAEDVIFTGDTLFAGSIGRTDFPGGDWDTICSSLIRLSELPENLSVYPGHGESTTIGAENRTNPFVTRLL